MDQQLQHRLTDRQYSEAEGLLQAMDMPSSDQEEIESDSCRLSRYNIANLYENGMGRQRCYTMPHVPPAPPSTPTLLTSNSNSNGNCSSVVPVSSNGTSSSPTANLVSDNQINHHFIYVKNGKNLRRESRCVDSELSKLFSVVSITNRLAKNRAHKQQLSERGIINASRTISKLHGVATTSTKIFKIDRDPKEFLREADEDSVSAPEYDDDEEDTRFRFFRRRRVRCVSHSRKLARFNHRERMEAMLDSFDAAMSFNDADT
ncbi:CG8617 [Drosophila busckii]|uniref:CG8617 n=1 Tax=Drosophila busckii TaxID=30019 RepID=A0A0M5JAI5_DROBS|nr:uncharacterized protein LOC108596683 [Drosophila busckii]ALC42544.1 CG8617 [Drosophila busckii]